MTKKEIRKEYRKKRMLLTSAQRSKLDDLMLIQFQTCVLPFIQALFTYWPIQKNNEPDIHLFADYLSFTNPGLVLAYPKSDFSSNSMTAIASNEEMGFTKNEFDVYEPKQGNLLDPEEIDMVLVPLLAFDTDGYRLGYGKGFYDKYLACCREDCIKIGFSYFKPIDEIPEKHDFDLPLNYCITPQKVYVF